MLRSFFHIIICLLVSLTCGCGNNNSENSDTAMVDEVEYIAQLWMETEDPSIVGMIKDEAQLRAVEELLLQWEFGEDTAFDPPVLYLPGCGGYWGTYRFAGKARFQDGSASYSYYWSPNCYMYAPGTDCGTDHDYMVSFWMGPDYYGTAAAYRVDGTSAAVDIDLLWHHFHSGGASFRQYTSNAYGAWYGNAYVCLSNWLSPDNLRFGRDY